MPIWLKIGLPLLTIGLLVWGAHTWRQSDIDHWKLEGRNELLAEQALEKEQKRVNKRNAKHEAQNLNDAGTNRELCKYGWLRDFENCPK